MQVSKSKLFSTAWALFKANTFSTFSESLKAAWSKLKLRAALLTGKVELTFRKSSGEITTRLSTLNSSLFSYESKGSGKSFKASLLPFYSLTDEGFRSLNITRLISWKAA